MYHVGSAWNRLVSRALCWKSITNIGHLCCKCELAIPQLSVYLVTEFVVL